MRRLLLGATIAAFAIAAPVASAHSIGARLSFAKPPTGSGRPSSGGPPTVVHAASTDGTGAQLVIPPPPLPLSHMFHYHRARAQHPRVWMTLYCQGRPHSGGIDTTGAWAGWWDGPGGICTTDEVIN